jgi:putative flippase GtrA
MPGSTAFIKYCLIGLFCALLDFLLFYVGISIGMNQLISNLISTGAAILFSYFANIRFTFKSKYTKINFVRFFVIAIVCLMISTAALNLLTRNTQISVFSIKIFLIPAISFLQFFLNLTYNTKD